MRVWHCPLRVANRFNCRGELGGVLGRGWSRRSLPFLPLEKLPHLTWKNKTSKAAGRQLPSVGMTHIGAKASKLFPRIAGVE